MFVDLQFVINKLWSSHVEFSSDVPKNPQVTLEKPHWNKCRVCAAGLSFFPYQHTKRLGWYIFFFKKIIQR